MTHENNIKQQAIDDIAHRFLEINGLRMHIAEQEFVPRVRQMVFEGCGHWLTQERAAEVNKTMIEFLQNISG